MEAQVKSIEELRELYGEPKERAVKKQLSKLDVHCNNFISKSPFSVLSSFSSKGQVDSSPRGGIPGYVKVLNENELVIPDWKGNNRIDSLMNILETSRIGILFFIPGMDETLRINGSAVISIDDELLDVLSESGKKPKTCILVTVEEAFLHCAKALMRSKLWSSDSHLERSEMPTMGQMLKDQIGLNGEPESQKAMIERYNEDL
ncbi:MAG: pyridoxamine 5'-phosphate oxidase family protein [Bacteroidota bacterium]